MLLFYKWAAEMNPSNDNMYAVKWDESKPRTTPDGLADPKKAVGVLEQVATQMKADYGSLSVPWGQFYRIKTPTQNLPGNGADGSVGVFRVAWPGGEDGKTTYIGGGDSWVGVIEFGEKIKAKVLLSYGNSTQSGSPHNGDQLKLFSEKKMRDAYFYKSDVETHKQKAEVVKAGKFVELKK
jgi:acyl-homoserine-lactone acylase